MQQYFVSCLPFMSSSCPIGDIGPQWRRLGETVRSNRGILIAILLLHPSPSYVASEPGGDILINFDHDEKDDAVDDYHAEDDTEIHPFWSVHINLEYILQDVLSRYLGKFRWLVVKQQALKIILVLSLKSFHCLSLNHLGRKSSSTSKL